MLVRLSKCSELIIGKYAMGSDLLEVHPDITFPSYNLLDLL